MTGGCQCGAVRFRIAGEPVIQAELCHCSMCRRAVGNIHMTSVNVRKDAVTWEGERGRYASSPFAERGFCATCGTPVSFTYTDSAHIDLMAGTFDHPETLHPATHFGVESRLEAFRHLDGLPEERTDSVPTIVARWEAAGGFKG